MASEPKRDTKRGIYLLPNLFTTATLFAGFYAIVSANNEYFSIASIAIFIAMLMDSLDGRIARILQTQSEFGAQYDSLADMVAFGVAPALVSYLWALKYLGKIGWLIAFFGTAAAAMRLARFNTQVGSADKDYFQGLSTPAGAGILVGLIWVCDDAGISGFDIAYWVACLVIIVGSLMVSNVRYHSFKQIDLRGRVPFVTLLAIVLLFVFISVNPPQVLFAVLALYGLSGPVFTLWQLHSQQRKRKTRKNPTYKKRV